MSVTIRTSHQVVSVSGLQPRTHSEITTKTKRLKLAFEESLIGRVQEADVALLALQRDKE